MQIVAFHDDNTDKDRQIKMSIVHSRDQSKFSLVGLIRSENSMGPFNHIRKLGHCSRRNGNILKSFK